MCHVTTTGRVSGLPRRIEIWYLDRADGLYLLSGNGERSDWVRNMRADSRVAVELPPATPGASCEPLPYRADIGPFDDDQAVRQAMDSRYHGWSPGQPPSDWIATAVVVRLVPDLGRQPAARPRGSLGDAGCVGRWDVDVVVDKRTVERAMLIDLSSRDESAREQALEGVESAATAGDDELARLFTELTADDSSSELGMSYRTLALSIVVRIDAGRQPVLRFDGDSSRRLEPLLQWWSSTGDRNDLLWEQDCGWVDSIGHGAELAGAVGQHPTTSTAVLADVATRTARLAGADRRFVASEGERLAIAFALLTARAPQVLDELDPRVLWETRSAANPSAPGWKSHLNVHAFLSGLATIWTFGVAVPEGGINLPPRGLGSPESIWLRGALASTDTSGLWALR